MPSFILCYLRLSICYSAAQGRDEVGSEYLYQD